MSADTPESAKPDTTATDTTATDATASDATATATEQPATGGSGRKGSSRGARGRSRGGRLGAISGRTLAGIALAVVLIAAVVSTVVLGLRYADARATEQARESALSAARDYASTMFGYDPTNVGEHVDKSLNVLTGKAKPEYVKLITDSNLVAEVGKQKVVSAVTLQDAGVVTNTRDTAKVLLFMNQSVTRGDKELVSINPSRLTFSMQKDGDRWMINDIEVITDDTLRSKIEVVESLPPGAKPLPGQQTSTPAPTPPTTPSPAPMPVPTP